MNRKQDYLRIIYELEEKRGTRSIDLAEKLNISKASVSEMLRKLSKENLIKLEPYSKIKLTKKGKNIAEKQSDNHIIIVKFLKKVFNYEHKKAIEESHHLEHAFSNDSISRMKRIINEIKPESIPSYIG